MVISLPLADKSEGCKFLAYWNGSTDEPRIKLLPTEVDGWILSEVEIIPVPQPSVTKTDHVVDASKKVTASLRKMAESMKHLTYNLKR